MVPDEEAPQEAPEELPPYIIEAARSGRAKCKTCQRKIDQGAVRLGILVEGRFGAGHMWHHLPCAAKRLLDQVEEAYALSSWEAAKDPLDPDELPTLEKLREIASKAEVEREKKEKTKKTIPYAEIAPSNRSKCKQSGEAIDKGIVRIVLGKEAHFGGQTRTAPFAVLPRFLMDALEDPEIAQEADEGLVDELRANSEIDPELFDQAMAEAGL